MRENLKGGTIIIVVLQPVQKQLINLDGQYYEMRELDQIVLKQFRALLFSAITLKEKFDQNEDPETLVGYFEIFKRDVEALKISVPSEILSKGHLLRHFAWLEKRLYQGKPQDCYSDINAICLYDIFFVEQLYFSNITVSESDDEVGLIRKKIEQLEGDFDADAWLESTQRLLQTILSDRTINLKKKRVLSGGFGFSKVETNRFRDLLEGYILELKAKRNKHISADKWEKIDPCISSVAESRFETGHYADAVEAVFKEVNDIVKQEYFKYSKKEEDGDSLMKRSFSAQAPCFLFDDIKTESGKSIQQGYMEIFAGAMKGVRNPKAHANLEVDPDEAWELIVLGSHLMRMWNKAKHISEVNPVNQTQN